MDPTVSIAAITAASTLLATLIATIANEGRHAREVEKQRASDARRPLSEAMTYGDRHLGGLLSTMGLVATGGDAITILDDFGKSEAGADARQASMRLDAALVELRMLFPEPAVTQALEDFRLARSAMQSHAGELLSPLPSQADRLAVLARVVPAHGKASGALRAIEAAVGAAVNPPKRRRWKRRG